MYKIKLVFVFLFSFILLFIGCSVAEDRIIIREICFNEQEIELEVGETYTLNYYSSDGYYSNYEYTYSSNPSVVSVNGLTIKAIRPGHAIITLITDGAIAACHVIVHEEMTICDTFVFESDVIWIETGQQKIISNYFNSNLVSSDKIKFSSENENIAVVNDGMVYAISTGTVEISASYKGIVTNCVIKVLPDVDNSGTYLINTCEDLSLFRDYVNDGNSHVNAKLLSNINLNNDMEWESWNKDTLGLTNWIPIGTKEYPYSGVFDGNGYVIKGIYHSCKGDNDLFVDESYIGLFGCVDGGQIKHLGIESGYIYCAGKNGSIGGIVGYIKNGDVVDCFNSAILISSLTDTRYGDGIGGIIGYGDNSNIERCFTTSSCSVISEKGQIGVDTGGIAGYISDSNLVECCNKATVIGYNNDSNIGGLAGTAYNTKISNCYNSGKIWARLSENIEESAIRVGGLIGYLGGPYSVFRNCYNIGKVTAPSHDSFDPDDSLLVGSIIGSYYPCSMYLLFYLTGSFFCADGEYKSVNHRFYYLLDSSEMKEISFLGQLNRNEDNVIWLSDKENINDGFPVLWWEPSTYWQK